MKNKVNDKKESEDIGLIQKRSTFKKESKRKSENANIRNIQNIYINNPQKYINKIGNIILVVIIMILSILSISLFVSYNKLKTEKNDISLKKSNKESNSVDVSSNTSVPITEEKAIEIAKDYNKNSLMDKSDDEFYEVKTGNIYCNSIGEVRDNEFFIDRNVPLQDRTIGISYKEIPVYVVTQYESNKRTKELTFYIDLYSGKIYGYLRR